MDAQPPMINPYTPMVAMATMNSMPVLTSVMNQESAPGWPARGPMGMTEKMMNAGPTTRQGARMKAHFTASFGVVSSFTRSFITSASGWSRPHGPTRFGPTRACM